MKAVADELAVRPGLISHYFDTVDALLCEAFAHAASRERASLLPPEEGSLPPREQLARFLHRIDGAASPNLGRLWLNARHLARYRPTLRQVVEEQETITREGSPASSPKACGAVTSPPTIPSTRASSSW